jgi:hypothetical protein
MQPIRYEVVGQDDFMLEIRIRADGSYQVNAGDYTSHAPRKGVLDRERAASIEAALASLGEPREHRAPEGAEGFMAVLVVGEPTARPRVYRFWEGALDEEPDLRALVRQLELL